jgi:hypothetical protein
MKKILSTLSLAAALALSGCYGVLPTLPIRRTVPVEAANYEKVMASAKIGQTSWRELGQQLGSSMGSDAHDSTLTPKLHAMYCRWEVQYSFAVVVGGWANGRDWETMPGEHMLMIDFDEDDRLKRFKFQTVSNWDDCEKVFSQWIQQAHQRIPLVMPPPENAATTFRRRLESAQQQFGNDSTNAANTKADLASELLKQGQFAEAEQLSREALAVQRQQLGDGHPFVANTLGVLSGALRGQGRLVEAETARRENLAIRRKVFGDQSPQVRDTLARLNELLKAEGKPPEELAKPGGN